MINAVFTGGLGNQMFLYAYIYAQIKQNNLEPCIYAVMHKNKYEDERKFALSTLNCSIKMQLTEEKQAKNIVKIKKYIRKLLIKIFKKVNMKNEKIIQLFNKINICCSPTIFEYYPNLKVKNNTYIEGAAFQSWKYFKGYDEQIKNEFLVTEKMSDKNNEILKDIKLTNSVCVHIRRGDYTNSFYSSTLQICNYDYYKRAMQYIATKVENPTFYIFSNSHEDHEWIKEHYKFDYNVIYVDLDNPDYEELRLMYSCKHFIISNSSFSWWAQYLSKSEEKEVVAPSKWHLEKGINTEDIYMPNWHVIEVKEELD